MIFTVIVCYLISWTPYALVTLLAQFGDSSHLSPLLTSMPAIFAKASVVYNPIIYSYAHPHVRAMIKVLKTRHCFLQSMVSCFQCKKSNSNSSHNYPQNNQVQSGNQNNKYFARSGGSSLAKRNNHSSMTKNALGVRKASLNNNKGAETCNTFVMGRLDTLSESKVRYLRKQRSTSSEGHGIKVHNSHHKHRHGSKKKQNFFLETQDFTNTTSVCCASVNHQVDVAQRKFEMCSRLVNPVLSCSEKNIPIGIGITIQKTSHSENISSCCCCGACRTASASTSSNSNPANCASGNNPENAGNLE